MRGALLAILLSKSFVALAANNCRLVFPADYASQAVPTDEPLKIEVLYMYSMYHISRLQK